MKKSFKTKIYFSRFLIILLSIFAQAIGMWIVLYWLGQKASTAFAISVYALTALLIMFIVNKDQSACYKLPWVILILVFPYGGIMCYFTFGNRKMSKREMRKYRSIYDERHDAYYRQDEVLKELKADGGKGIGIVKYLRHATSLPVYDNSRATYLKNGETFFESLKDELRVAEKYIFLEYFIIDEGIVWDEIHDILKQKVAEGVKVYVMYDDVGCMSKIPANFNRLLMKDGIDARKFHKFIPIVSVSHNNRDHRKIAVIDGRVGFMGGTNLADEYANITKPYGRWLDSSVKIEGQATDSLVRLFIQLFNMTAGKKLDEKDYIVEEHEQFSDGYMYPFGDSPAPITYEHIGENVYLDIINRSDEYLYIETPYLIVDNNITDALKNAARRGVDVRIIIPDVPDKKAIYALTKSSCLSLMSQGVKIYTYRGGFIHSKCFLSDGDTAVIGTVNLDFRSLVHHFECATVFYKSSLINDLYADFHYLFDVECDLRNEKTLQLKWYERLIKSVMAFFAPLM